MIARPLSALHLKNEGGRYENTADFIEKSALFPELKRADTPTAATEEILDGNALFLVDGVALGFVVGAKLLPNHFGTYDAPEAVPHNGSLNKLKAMLDEDAVRVLPDVIGRVFQIDAKED